MIDEQKFPVCGVLDTDPDSIPRGFIHRDPDILNVEQQNTLSEMIIKMADFNEEYLAKHPQVEALARLLITELILHKPYYVREFIKEILSREDLETQIAMIVADREINLDRRHARHYFSHTQTWQDKAAGKDEPPPLEKPLWPDPWPYSKSQTRRDKREYCHPHYFKVPYAFYPAEYFKLKKIDLRRKKTPKFYSKEYARQVLENYKDVWGDPVTNIPPPMTNEEIYTAFEVLDRKEPAEMTNDELIKTCLRCRRLKLRNYVTTVNRRDFLAKSKRYGPLAAMKASLPLKAGIIILKKTMEAIRKGQTSMVKPEKKEKGAKAKMPHDQMKFQTLLVPHPPIAKLNDFKSPVPGLRFKEKGVIKGIFPLSDLRRPFSDQAYLRKQSEITLYSQRSVDGMSALPTRLLVPTKDLEGNIVSETELAFRHKHSRSKKNKEEDLSRDEKGPNCRFFSVIDERTLLIDKHGKKKRSKESEENVTSSKGSRRPRKARKERAPDSYICLKMSSSERSMEPPLKDPSSKTDSKQQGPHRTTENITSTEYRPTQIKPHYLENPVVSLSINTRVLSRYFRRKEGKQIIKEPLQLDMDDLKRFI